MAQNCPHCGAENRDGTPACEACGRGPGRRGAARRGREYDGYEVGRRVLRVAPAWLLGLTAAFVLMLLAFGWAARRAGREAGEFRNEASNSPAAPGAAAPAGDAGRKPERTPPAAVPEGAKPDAAPEAVAHDAPHGADVFSVQVGAFAELSQANEQVSRLRAAGFEARVVEPDAATRFRFQVRSGGYATREEAAALASRLRAAGAAAQAVIIEPEKK
jgi:hypothetical protein